jgi:FeS assembly SUF system protein
MSDDLRQLAEDALRTVFDPEIPVNVFDLGLVYAIDVDGSSVKVTMTLTAPACPAAPEILFDAENKIRAIPGVGDVHMNLTFDPPWTREMMSEEAKLELGFL